MPEDLTVTPAEAAALGASLLAQDRPFHAHEVFEAAWKSSSGPDRELWRGLAQIAVGLTHARRGNARGAVALLRRGARAVGGYPGAPGAPGTHGVDGDYVAAAAAAIATRIERDGLEAVPADELRLALTRRASRGL
jgi:predicted metal-dependent hydrolase